MKDKFGKPFNREYSLREKIDYYNRRADDDKLTSDQRFYAISFLEGVKQAKYGVKKNPPSSLEQQRKWVDDVKKQVALNKEYHGDVAYFQGMLAVEKDELRKKRLGK